MARHRYIKIDGKWVQFEKLPCSKCDYRFTDDCPKCDWNKGGKYDTYRAVLMEDLEARDLNAGNAQK